VVRPINEPEPVFLVEPAEFVERNALRAAGQLGAALTPAPDQQDALVLAVDVDAVG
jgi:hypothetical protein